MVLAVANILKARYWNEIYSKKIISNRFCGERAYIYDALSGQHERRGFNRRFTLLVKAAFVSKVTQIVSFTWCNILRVQLNQKYPLRICNPNNATGGQYV